MSLFNRVFLEADGRPDIKDRNLHSFMRKLRAQAVKTTHGKVERPSKDELAKMDPLARQRAMDAHNETFEKAQQSVARTLQPVHNYQQGAKRGDYTAAESKPWRRSDKGYDPNATWKEDRRRPGNERGLPLPWNKPKPRSKTGPSPERIAQMNAQAAQMRKTKEAFDKKKRQATLRGMGFTGSWTNGETD